MNIIIAGAGKVGYSLAEHLTREKHNITIVDKNEDAIRKASETLDVMCIQGNAGSIGALKSAGVQHADVVIAATSGDELNMVICLSSKKLGAGYTIARIRDTDYSKDLSMLRRELDINMVINPEYATAVEISRLLRFPAATNIETFYRGRVEMVDFRAAEGDFIVGSPIRSVTKRISNLPVLFCAIEHGDELIIPNGDSVIQVGDRVHIIGDILGITQFFKILGRLTQKVRDVMILGGGRIAFYLATLISRMNMDLKIIEQDMERCTVLSAAFPNSLIIHGDGTDQELLDSENVHRCGAFVALMDRDEYNFITSLYAMQSGASKIIAKANRLNYAGLVRGLGIDSVVSPKQLAANQILQVVRGLQNSKGSVMETMYRIVGGRAEALEFIVSSNTRNLGIPLRSLRLRRDVLIAAIARHEKLIIPEGGDHIESGDNVIIVARADTIMDLNDIFEGEAGPAK